MTKPSIEERFAAKIGAPTDTGCTEWLAYRDPSGRGQFGVKRKAVSAARVAWAFAHGDPGAADVLHRCGNTACVNPSHLVLAPSAVMLTGLPRSITTIDHIRGRAAEQFNGCWLWLRGKDRDGYGVAWLHGKGTRAHRIAWELVNGQIPSGALICHKCDTPACVNPDHLFIGTPLDNMQDMIAKGRAQPPRGNSHGSRLHPDSVPRGERRPNARLADATVREIRASAESLATLASAHHVGVRTIRDVRSRKTWRHVI